MSFPQDIRSRRIVTAGKEDPTQALASGVFQINTAVSTFQRLVNTLGTTKDTPELREKLSQTRVRIQQLAKDTSAKLKQAASDTDDEQVSASKKKANGKLVKDFQAVLKEFLKAQRLAAEREEAYDPFVPSSNSYTAESRRLEVLLQELQKENDEAKEFQKARRLAAEREKKDLLQLDNEILYNEAILEEREQGTKEIQQQIFEVKEIFKDLAVLVQDRGALIDEIGNKVESSSYAPTVQAISQAKLSKTQNSNSSPPRNMASKGLTLKTRCSDGIKLLGEMGKKLYSSVTNYILSFFGQKKAYEKVMKMAEDYKTEAEYWERRVITLQKQLDDKNDMERCMRKVESENEQLKDTLNEMKNMGVWRILTPFINKPTQPKKG